MTVGALGTAFLAAAAAPAAAAPDDPRLATVEDFAFALGVDPNRAVTAARLAPYDLVVVDGEQATRGAVARLRSKGAIVLGYLSVGTIEPYRSWYRKLKPFRLRDRFEEFGEFYARASAAGFRRAIAGRIAPRILRKGFDGLFLDNTDMVETHAEQRRGMRRLVRRLSRLVHARDGLLFAQNGDRSVRPLLRHLDGWNREDVSSTYSFKRRRYVRTSARDRSGAQRALRRASAAGLLATATDYLAGGDTTTAALALVSACEAGAIPFASNIALTRIPAIPARCPP